MSTSTIVLYSVFKSFIDKNFVVENVLGLLVDSHYTKTTITKTINDFQYIKIQKNLVLKLNLGQIYSEPRNFPYNYVRIQNSDNNINYYYVVRNVRWISSSCVEVQLEMDVLNTFEWFEYDSQLPEYGYQLDDHSLIRRKHKDRGSAIKYSTTPLIRFYKPESPLKYFYSFVEDASFTSGHPVTFSISYKNLQKACLSPVSHVLPIRNIGLQKTSGTITIQLINGAYFEKENHEANWIWFHENKITFGKGTIQSPSAITYTYDADKLIPNTSNANSTLLITINGNVNKMLYDNIDEEWKSASNSLYKHFSQMFESYIIDSPVTKAFNKIVDNYPESINPILFHVFDNDEILTEEDGMNSWYLIYKNHNAVVDDSSATSEKFVNPVEILLCSDSKIKTSGSNPIVRLYPSMCPEYDNIAEYITIFFDESTEVIINGVTYNDASASTIVLKKRYNGQQYFDKVWIYHPNGDMVLNNIPYVDIIQASDIEVSVALSDNGPFEYKTTLDLSSYGSGTYKAWQDLDLTDAKFIKAINLPYSPLAGLTHIDDADISGLVVDGETETLAVDKTQTISFDRTITFDNDFIFQDFQVNISNLTLDEIYTNTISPYVNDYYDCESKMINPEFYLRKFVYDSYTFSFPYDYSDEVWGNLFPEALVSKFYVRYVVSKNMLSKFMFQFPQFKEYKDIVLGDYPDVLIVDRNNEKALYNNAYINYIKTGGFSYDSGKNQRINSMNGLTTALTIGGAVASFLSTGITGGFGVMGGVTLLTTGIGSLARTINTAKENDRALAQRMNDLSIQATNVNAQDDVEIFSSIEGNKAKLVTYAPSGLMNKNIRMLFHKFGYACNEYAKIDANMLNSRIFFNYIQADIEFANCSVPTEYLEEIKKKWSEGITFIHRVSYNGTITWDVFQEHENWEVQVKNVVAS